MDGGKPAATVPNLMHGNQYKTDWIHPLAANGVQGETIFITMTIDGGCQITGDQLSCHNSSNHTLHFA
jgi:hypothetical protein